MTGIIDAARELAEQISETLDDDQRVSYLDVLDALASSGLTLAVDDGTVSETYRVAVEMEGLLI